MLNNEHPSPEDILQSLGWYQTATGEWSEDEAATETLHQRWLDAKPRQQLADALPEGWMLCIVEKEPGIEPSWNDVKFQAETATGLTMPPSTFNIVVREVRRWLLGVQRNCNAMAVMHGSEFVDVIYGSDIDKRIRDHKDHLENNHPKVFAATKFVPLRFLPIESEFRTPEQNAVIKAASFSRRSK